MGRKEAVSHTGDQEAAEGGGAEKLAILKGEEVSRSLVIVPDSLPENVVETEEIPTEEYVRDPVIIAGHVLPCCVLSNEMRVLSQRGVTATLGGKRGGSHWRRARTFAEGEYLPVFLSAGNLAPFISPELRHSLSRPVRSRTKQGGAIGYGMPADLLPAVCDVYLKAHMAGRLTEKQKPIAEAARILIGGLAKTGIIAMVDEASGYQEVRQRLALQRILAAYISPDLMPYVSRFPSQFYEHLFRLRKWQWNPMSVKRPRRVGKDTVYIVYDRLPRGVLEELRRRNPEVKPGYRRHKHYQFLTEDIGDPALERVVGGATALMAISKTWEVFKRRLEVALPMPDKTLPIPGMEWAGREDSEEED